MDALCESFNLQTHLLDIRLKTKNKCIRASVKSVRRRYTELIKLMNRIHNSKRRIRQVVQWWKGVQADGVQLVRFLHDTLGKGCKVVRGKGQTELIDAFLGPKGEYAGAE